MDTRKRVTQKRVVGVSVKRGKRDRARQIKTILNESTVVSVATGESVREYPHLPLIPAHVHEARRAERPHDDECITRCPEDPTGCRIGHSCWCTEAAPVTDGIGVIRLDPALLAMLREHVAVVRKVYPEIWDNPSWDDVDDLEAVHVAGVDGLEFAHAIGFVAGAAAMMDLTPRMLIDNLRL